MLLSEDAVSIRSHYEVQMKWSKLVALLQMVGGPCRVSDYHTKFAISKSSGPVDWVLVVAESSCSRPVRLEAKIWM